MKYLLFLLLAFILTNCKQERNSVSNFEFYPNAITTSIDSFYKQKISILTSIYNLPKLTKGTSDSIVIRFWPWEAFQPFENMLEFRLDSNGWKGHHYCSYTVFTGEGFQYIKRHEDLGDSVLIVKQIIPKCGWNKFSDSLTFFQLRSLPTQTFIKNFQYQAILDGDGFQFEIATKNSYRWINYSHPSSYSYKECQQIKELVNMFKRQLGHSYYWPIKRNT